ncbi:hypothetical protein [uncultured Clostridium sp.]|uniref:hypothetical protein n=1 Tax=uncultured Clostridium sp. TaxID=59620 RepID=UPI0026EDFDF8|nr:hypothetical protein [uncultured Clostridium sp.]
MWVYLNDGRKVNMFWVVSFYQDKKDVIYEMAKGHGLKVIEPFGTEDEAEKRVEQLEEEYVS